MELLRSNCCGQLSMCGGLSFRLLSTLKLVWPMAGAPAAPRCSISPFPVCDRLGIRVNCSELLVRAREMSQEIASLKSEMAELRGELKQK